MFVVGLPIGIIAGAVAPLVMGPVAGAAATVAVARGVSRGLLGAKINQAADNMTVAESIYVMRARRQLDLYDSELMQGNKIIFNKDNDMFFQGAEENRKRNQKRLGASAIAGAAGGFLGALLIEKILPDGKAVDINNGDVDVYPASVPDVTSPDVDVPPVTVPEAEIPEVTVDPEIDPDLPDPDVTVPKDVMPLDPDFKPFDSPDEEPEPPIRGTEYEIPPRLGTITARTPDEFVRGAFHQLSHQGFEITGVSNERVHNIVDVMRQEHLDIVAGMKINPGTPGGELVQNVIDIGSEKSEWASGRTDNFAASGEGAFASRADIEAFLRIVENHDIEIVKN